MTTEISELEDLDVHTLHFVKAGANGFRELLAKAEGDTPCPTCGGKKTILQGNRKCPDCAGTGNATTVEKALACECDACLVLSTLQKALVAGDDGEIAKAELSSAKINDLPDSAFAYIEGGGKKDDEGKTTPRSLRHFPVHDEAHARNALARAPQSPFGPKAMPKIRAACHKFGIEISDEADKGLTIKDGGAIVSALNQAGSSGPYPGSPEWEAQDAQILIDAGTSLADAGRKLQQVLDREQTEVAVGGKPHDVEDVFDLEDALSALDAVLGITARMAFTEQAEGQAAGVSKAGRRLSGVSVDKVVAARTAADQLRTHLTDLLGPDDPAAAGGKTATKGAFDMEMTQEQFDAAVTAKAGEVAAKAIADHEAKKAKVEADAVKAAADEKAAKKAAKKAKAEKRAAKVAAAAKAEADRRAAMSDAERATDDAAKAEADKAKADAAMLRTLAKLVAKKGDADALIRAAKAVQKGEAPDETRKEIAELRATVEKVAGEVPHSGRFPLSPGAGTTAAADVMKALAGFTRGDGIGGETQEAVAKSFDDRIEAAEKAGNDMEADYLRAEKARVIMTRAEIGRGFPTDGGPEKVPSPAVVAR